MNLRARTCCLFVGLRRKPYTTNCLRERRRLVMNLRVRTVTAESAMIALKGLSDQGHAIKRDEEV
jgi:hypothetical protein